MRLRTCVMMLAVSMIAAPTTAKTIGKSDAPVLAIIDAFADARAKYDAARLGRLLTSDYVEVSPRGELDRRPAVLSFYAAEKVSAVPPMVFSVQDVRRHGDTAIVIGSIEYTVAGPNQVKVKRAVRVTYVQRRVGGRWLMASTHFTGIPAAQPGH